jgi:hypothetical protein
LVVVCENHLLCIEVFLLIRYPEDDPWNKYRANMLAALQNWTDHTASRLGRCNTFGEDCSFINTMPEIQKICLKGSNASGGDGGSRSEICPKPEKISLKESISSGEEGSDGGEGSSDEEGCGSVEASGSLEGCSSGEACGSGEGCGNGEGSGSEEVSGSEESCPGCCCQVQ